MGVLKGRSHRERFQNTKNSTSNIMRSSFLHIEVPGIYILNSLHFLEMRESNVYYHTY